MASKHAAAERDDMKMRQLISLIVGITAVTLSPITWAAGHGGGSGGFGGGGGHTRGAGGRVRFGAGGGFSGCSFNERMSHIIERRDGNWLATSTSGTSISSAIGSLFLTASGLGLLELEAKIRACDEFS